MKINTNNVSLKISAGEPRQFPKNPFPQIAFSGRSNVGKSSLINTLLNRKSMARVSSAPGKTITVNFYDVDNKLFLVDLPGYGYAKVSVSEKEKWGKMIEKYLHKSKKLRLVFLLVDIRHDPGANDKQMYQWILNQGYEPVIIATKLDKINRSQIQKHIKMLKTGLQVVPGTIVIPFSAQTKQGREEIYELLDSYLEKEQEV